MAAHTQFVVQFLEMFFLAHGFCLFVNIFVFPESSRDVVFAEIKRYLSFVRSVLSAESFYVESLAKSPILGFDNGAVSSTGRSMEREHNSEFKTLKSEISSLSELHSRLSANITLAKKDVGWSTISGDDLDELLRLFRRLILPLRGMTVLMSIFRRLCERRGWAIFEDTVQTAGSLCSEKLSPEDDNFDKEEYREIFVDLSESVNDINAILGSALRHVSHSLGLEKHSILGPIWKLHRTRKKADLDDAEAQPGGTKFGHHFEAQIRDFHARRGFNLVKWLQRKGFVIDNTTDDIIKAIHNLPIKRQNLAERNREQYFVILYMQNLFHGLSDAVLDLVKFSDRKSPIKPDAKKHLVFPSQKRLTKFVKNFLSDDDNQNDPAESSRLTTLPTGSSYRPAVSTAHQSRRHTIGSYLATASTVLAGHQSFFGFRVACAVLSVVIVALLKDTQKWFFNQRCLWAAVFIPFSMAPSSGETISLFMFRMIGTALAVGVAIINWYIVNGNPAGVIVFYFGFTFVEVRSNLTSHTLFLTSQNYFVIRYPQYMGVWKSSLITRAIITGYSLQSQFTHVPQPPATTNQHYPVYLIGPYRYACTAVGVFSAFIWTIFPTVVSARSLLRQKLADAFFILALYYSCMHSTVGLWAANSQGGTSAPYKPFSPQCTPKSVLSHHLKHSFLSTRTFSDTFIRFIANYGGLNPTNRPE